MVMLVAISSKKHRLYFIKCTDIRVWCKLWHLTAPQLLLFCFLSALFPLTAASETIEGKKTVLYLNSYHHGYHWSDGLLRGVRSVLNESEYKVDLQIEYMDTKKFPYSAISQNLLALYTEKFKNENFDAIVLSDNDALNFVNEFREVLFKDIPVVFCGINNLKPSDIAGGNITGVGEIFDLQATLEIALKLHPEKKRLVVLIDNSTAGKAIQRQVVKFAKNLKTDLEITFWIELSLPEAQRRVRKLPEDTFLFIAPYYQTIQGRFYTSEEVSEAIYRHSSVPIYTAWEFMVGYGPVGGRVLSGEEHGAIAGNMALQILGGKSAEEIPIIKEPGGTYLFDYAVIEKLDVDMTKLPKNSKIINSPEAIYSLSKELFWTIMISLILLLLTLVLLFGAMFERRKVELKILDQLTFQETLMDTIPQLVSWKDTEGRYLGANQAFATFFGIERSQNVVGKTTNDIVDDSTFANWSTEADITVLESKVAFRKVRRRVIVEDESETWIEVNKVPLRGQGGRLVGVLSTADNITKEQNLEKQLLQSQKMEALGTIAGGISHDFNNILTSIINSTELALGDVPGNSQTEADLQRVLKAARRGSRVVQQILTFSRPSTEGFVSTDLSTIVQEVVHLMEASTPANVNVSCNIDTDSSYIVLADPTQMHQAILNLTTNAYHALKEQGGDLEIALERITGDETTNLVEYGQEFYIKLSVTDNGPGIANEIKDKIFDPFFSTKSKTEGTGLGLAVVHGIIKSHRGIIQVTSEPDQGTVFEIILPESAMDDAIVSDLLSTEMITGGHILFVEDDEDQLLTTPRLLEAMGFTVTSFRDPVTALSFCTSEVNKVDILISDFDMPRMSGTELAKQVPEIPVILISGREDAKSGAANIANIKKVIIKPYQRNELRETIQSIKLG